MTSRLAEFHIEGLFGLYSHRIALHLGERITIIIGPNGRGKTVCLKFIEALFLKNFTYFLDIPFKSAEFSFTGGEKITVRTVEESVRGTIDNTVNRSLCINLISPDSEPVEWTPATIDKALRREIYKYVPRHWELVSTNIWIDRTDGEELTILELSDRYGIPKTIISRIQSDIPDGLSNLIRSIDCHLIETQRLLVLPPSNTDVDEDIYYPRPRRRTRESRLAIQQKAEKLKAIIKDTLTAYANLSQSLDRSFPLRVFEAQGSTKLSQEQLRQELQQLDKRRQALMDAGILDAEVKPVTLLGGNIEPGVAKALEIYVGDAVQKLNVFDSLRSRVDLFKDLIEKRFIDKALQIDRESGFKIISQTGSQVPLDKLSSGEQHQLILVFDLLFEVNENSLILIDEPELSLHVAWQKTFIESLTRIIALNAFDVLLATHSPALVAKHFDLAVELGPVDECVS